MPSQLLERRPGPDAGRAERCVAANARVGVAIANFFPRIGLTGILGASSGDLSSLLASRHRLLGARRPGVGPIFTFGRNWYGWRASQQDTEAARFVYEQTVLVALQEVSDALAAREKLALVRVEQERAVDSLPRSAAASPASATSAVSPPTSRCSTRSSSSSPPSSTSPPRCATSGSPSSRSTARIGGGWNQYPPYPNVPLPIAP